MNDLNKTSQAGAPEEIAESLVNVSRREKRR